jgi:hypothetical protein
MDIDETARYLKQLRDFEAQGLRPPGLGPLEITISTRARVDRETAAQFSELGVDRIVLLARRHADEDTILRFVDNAARALLS